MDRVHHAQPTPRGRRLLVRLGFLVFCGGLLLLLSSRPADAAERSGPKLLDPVGATLQATAKEADSIAGRATGSGSSTVGKAAEAVRQTVAPQPRPAAGEARSTVAATVKRGAPAVTSPVRRAAPPTRPVTSPARTATRPLTSAAKRVSGTTTGPLERAGKLAARPTTRAAEAVAGPVGRAAHIVAGPVVAPALRPLGPALRPLGAVVNPVGSALAPVGSALAPLGGTVGGLVGPLVPAGLVPLLTTLPVGVPGLTGSRLAVPAGPGAHLTGLEGTGPAGLTPSASQTTPARLATDSAGSAARPVRSWPALAGAASLPGVPASAELPAGGPDPLSISSGAGLGLAALAAALLLLGPLGRGRARPERSGVLSRSYLPLISPA